MTAAAQALLTILQARSHVAPKRLVAPGPDAAQRELLYQAATMAPDHGRLRPWRLIEVPTTRRTDLGAVFVQALLQRDPAALPDQIEAAREKALRAPLVLLAVVSGQESDPPVPVAERLISLGCALQNMRKRWAWAAALPADRHSKRPACASYLHSPITRTPFASLTWARWHRTNHAESERITPL